MALAVPEDSPNQGAVQKEPAFVNRGRTIQELSSVFGSAYVDYEADKERLVAAWHSYCDSRYRMTVAAQQLEEFMGQTIVPTVEDPEFLDSIIEPDIIPG